MRKHCHHALYDVGHRQRDARAMVRQVIHHTIKVHFNSLIFWSNGSYPHAWRLEMRYFFVPIDCHKTDHQLSNPHVVHIWSIPPYTTPAAGLTLKTTQLCTGCVSNHSLPTQTSQLTGDAFIAPFHLGPHFYPYMSSSSSPPCACPSAGGSVGGDSPLAGAGVGAAAA